MHEWIKQVKEEKVRVRNKIKEKVTERTRDEKRKQKESKQMLHHLKGSFH
jgi:hypothetical protein